MRIKPQQLAVWGEDLAADYLEKKGYCILGRNIRSPYGEIDLIVQRDIQADISNGHRGPVKPIIVFVEVKTRSSTSFGYPEQSVDARKRIHLLACAQEYIRQHPDLDGEWRVDVIAILRTDQELPPEIEHFENAVTAD